VAGDVGKADAILGRPKVDVEIAPGVGRVAVEEHREPRVSEASAHESVPRNETCHSQDHFGKEERHPHRQ
jgi:hypothetical protein